MTHLLHRTIRSRPPLAVAGDGLILTLSDGRRIIDASGGAAVACLGHGDKRIAGAIARQAEKMAYAHTGFFSSEPAEALAELLVGHAPGGLTHAFFVSDGSVAMESALKLARQYHVERGEPQRVHYVSRRQSYHGNLFGTLAASGHAARRSIYEDVLPRNFSQVSPCFPYRHQHENETDDEYVSRLINEIEDEFIHVGPEKVIAFIAEPVVGATSGCVAATPGYFAAVRDICDKYGVLLILDEIMCGMGRTGTTHAWEQEDVVPDIQAVAKGLGGGYQPIGGILVSGRVIDILDGGTGAFVHGHTYQAHPVACAGALEVQRIIQEQQLVSSVRRLGEDLESCLKTKFEAHPHVGDIRGRGLFWALEFVKDKKERTPFPAQKHICECVRDAALDHGVGVYSGAGTADGYVGDHILIAPPYISTPQDIDEIVDRISRAVADILG